MPLLDGLRVVSSRIHGYGVVATRPFRAGEIICYGDGVLYAADADFDDTYALVLPSDSGFLPACVVEMPKRTSSRRDPDCAQVRPEANALLRT